MTEPSRRKSSWRLMLFGLAVVCVAVVVDWRQVGALKTQVETYIASFRKPAATQPHEAAAVPVSAAKAVQGDFPVVLTGLGNVVAYNTVLVRTRVDGQIMKLHFDEGQLVHAGDLLVEIDPRPFKAALDQATAKRQQDQANLDNARRDLNRYQSLAKSDFATRQQLDTQTSQVAQLTAQIAADDAAIENAKTQLDYTSIRAPITGRTGFRLVDTGNIVNASTQTGIVSIAQIEPISVVFTAPEDDLPAITAGQKEAPLKVAALTSDGGTTLATGKLEAVNNEITVASGTLQLKATFDNKDHKLWPGLSVSTKLTVATRKGVVLVPFAAVQHSPAGLYAFVIGPDNKVEQRPITVGLSDDQTAVIATGLKAGDQVVTAGQYRLQAGTLVKITADDAKTAQRES